MGERSRAPMPQEVCCNQFRSLLAVIEEHYGRQGVDTLLDGLINNEEFLVADRHDPSVVSPVAERHLHDPALWISNEFSLRLLANIHKVVTAPDPVAWAGEQCIRRYLSRHVLFIVKMVSPQMMCRLAVKLNPRFNRNKTVRLSLLEKGRARFELIYHPGFRVTKDICNWNLGVYRGASMLSGAREPVFREVACVTEGSDRCIFEYTWQEPRLLSRLSRSVLSNTIPELLEDYYRSLRDREVLSTSLYRSEERYRTLTENSLTGVFILQAGRLVFANNRLAELVGRPLSQLLGQRFCELVAAADQERVRRLIEPQEGSSPSSTRFEICLPQADGSERWLEVLATEIERRDSRALMGNVVDTTAAHRALEERQRFMARLHQAQKLEAIGRLAGGVAHDFNNLVTCIGGMAQLVQSKLPKESPHHEDLETILLATKKATALTRKLLAFSKQQALAPRKVDLHDTLLGLEQLLRHIVGRDIELECRCQEVRPVFVDPTQIEQVLLNLAVNAREAMPEGGRLTFALGEVELKTPQQAAEDELAAGWYVSLRVSDNGVGIPQEMLAHVFEPFFSTKESGTGLGLATVHGIVKQSGGSIEVTSALKVGTTFTIMLPLAETAPN